MTTAELLGFAAAQEIRDVIGRIARCTDFGALEDYDALLAEDVVVQTEGGDRCGIPDYVRNGRSEYVKAIAAQRANGVLGPDSDSRHVVVTACVAANGIEGEAWSHWFFYTQTASSPQLRMMGRYDDRFRQTADGWRLAHRRMAFG